MCFYFQLLIFKFPTVRRELKRPLRKMRALPVETTRYLVVKFLWQVIVAAGVSAASFVPLNIFQLNGSVNPGRPAGNYLPLPYKL